jgi:hypothetical protein
MAPHDNFKKSDQSYVPMIDIVAVHAVVTAVTV